MLHGLRQSTVGHTAIGLWRHPESQAHRYRNLGFWLETARILERGRFPAARQLRASFGWHLAAVGPHPGGRHFRCGQPAVTAAR